MTQQKYKPFFASSFVRKKPSRRPRQAEKKYLSQIPSQAENHAKLNKPSLAKPKSSQSKPLTFFQFPSQATKISWLA
jgi:hypothetical protein